jgi:predicted O-methyltransferase YrrM
MTPGRGPTCAVEAIGVEASARWRAGETEPVLGALVARLAPERALAIGSAGAAALAAALEGRALGALHVIEADAAAARRAAAALATGPGVAVHHASLGADPRAPHVTRVRPLVQALRADGFDLVVLDAVSAPEALYLELALALAWLREGGVLVCEAPARVAGWMEAAERIEREGNGTFYLWETEPGGPSALLARERGPAARRTHEETAVLRDRLPAEDPALAAALAAGDHVAAAARVRHWLAVRLAWSTPDLLLPLDCLPPPLSPLDVVEQCRLGEGGVTGFGAAVTLAMLYRAFGWPATVYQHGVPGVFWHMATLVRVPDGRLLLEDALFDAAPELAGRPVTFPEVIALARAGGADLLVFPSHPGAVRPHLYSRASLAGAEAGGLISPAERAALEAEMRGCRRLFSEPRAALLQPTSTSLARFAAVPVHARALGEVARRTGIASPAGLLGLPCGGLPLTGDVRADRAIVEALGAGERSASAAVGA